MKSTQLRQLLRLIQRNWNWTNCPMKVPMKSDSFTSNCTAQPVMALGAPSRSSEGAAPPSGFRHCVTASDHLYSKGPQAESQTWRRSMKGSVCMKGSERETPKEKGSVWRSQLNHVVHWDLESRHTKALRWIPIGLLGMCSDCQPVPEMIPVRSLAAQTYCYGLKLL